MIVNADAFNQTIGNVATPGPGGECVGLFHPDSAADPVQGRHLDYHWDGERVDLYRDLSGGEVYRIL